MPIVTWNAHTERAVNRGLPVLSSRHHSLAGLGESAGDSVESSLSTTATDLQDAVKRVLMEKAALQTGISVALAVAQSVLIGGQIIAAVYAIVQSLFSAKYKAQLQEHLDAFDAWAKQQSAASDMRMEAIQNAAWLKIRANAITSYMDARSKGINSTGALAKLSPWWQDLVAKYNKPNSAPTAAGVGELFPTGLSGLAWIGDDEIIADHIRSPAYTGLAHVVDAHGKHYGSVWYDGRLLYPRNSLGDFWSDAVDTVTGTYRTISSQVVSLVPKIANILPPVAAIKHIVVPVMRDVGWEGTATKLDHGTTAAGNVAAALVVTYVTAGAAGAIGGTAVGVVAPVVVPLVAAQNIALVGAEAVRLVAQPVVELIDAAGLDAKQAGAFLDKVGDKGEQYASDPGAAIHDAHTIADTLTGKETVNQADDQIAKGKMSLLTALAQRESEASVQLNSDAYQSTAAGMLTCRMIEDPAFARQLLAMANIEAQQQAAQQAKSSGGLLMAAAAAAAGGLFLMHG